MEFIPIKMLPISAKCLHFALTFLICFINVEGCNDNIALHRPSLKSYLPFPGSMPGMPPNVMNNGVLDHLCSGMTSPRAWMSIDLGQPTYVSAVHVTNTAGGTAVQRAYLTNFLTWLCSASPILGSIVDTSVCSLCLQYPGAVVGTAEVDCSTTFPAYRYVVIQSASTGLCLAEIEVYQVCCPPLNVMNSVLNTTNSNFSTVVQVVCDSGYAIDPLDALTNSISIVCTRNGNWSMFPIACQLPLTCNRADALFHRYYGHRLAGATTSTNYTLEARSQMECCALCRSTADCKSVNFRRQPRSSSGELSCVPLASTLPIGANEQLINDVDWDWLYTEE